MIAKKASPWQPLRALILAPLETTRVATKLGAPKTPRLGLAQPPASTSEKIPLETKTNTGLQPGGGLVFIPSGSTGAQGEGGNFPVTWMGMGNTGKLPRSPSPGSSIQVQGRAVERCGVERTLKPIWFHPLPPDQDAPSLVFVSISSRVFTPPSQGAPCSLLGFPLPGFGFSAPFSAHFSAHFSARSQP